MYYNILTFSSVVVSLLAVVPPLAMPPARRRDVVPVCGEHTSYSQVSCTRATGAQRRYWQLLVD